MKMQSGRKNQACPSAKNKSPRSSHKLAAQSGENLNEYVFCVLKEDILACELPPGEEISEGNLIARYGFSKAPVRNALLRLHQDGLVVSHGRLGNAAAPA